VQISGAEGLNSLVVGGGAGAVGRVAGAKEGAR
jgi:hypothetical protein